MNAFTDFGHGEPSCMRTPGEERRAQKLLARTEKLTAKERAKEVTKFKAFAGLTASLSRADMDKINKTRRGGL
jgi:hypothetical protein